MSCTVSTSLSLGRLGVKVKSLVDEMQAAGKKCIVISMMPLTQMAAKEVSSLALQTTWNKLEPHVTPVYSS